MGFFSLLTLEMGELQVLLTVSTNILTIACTLLCTWNSRTAENCWHWYRQLKRWNSNYNNHLMQSHFNAIIVGSLKVNLNMQQQQQQKRMRTLHWLLKMATEFNKCFVFVFSKQIVVFAYHSMCNRVCIMSYGNKFAVSKYDDK